VSAIGDKLRALGYEPTPSGALADANTDLASQLSQLVQVEVPDDYRAFLAEFPRTGTLDVGVACVGLVTAYFAPDGKYTTELLFASSTRSREDILAVRRAQIQKAEIPLYVLLIGEDLFGDFYCMDLRPESFGKIYFWNHEQRIEEGLYLVGNNFNSLIENLRRGEPE
jgi:hypothetical protein